MGALLMGEMGSEGWEKGAASGSVWPLFLLTECGAGRSGRQGWAQCCSVGKDRIVPKLQFCLGV